ncbi:MAG: glycosyl hydrolase [Sedimentisphaerales bacterium]|nr:glycosyl hydrolase [Sedimentisphaerales bacterium]
MTPRGWHWTGGNVTLDGITKDLEWMKRAGIAGCQLADVSFGTGQAIEDKVLFGSDRWYQALRHAASEAKRLGLELAIFSSPGWSLTGGPWVRPEQAMKKLVWSQTIVQGPGRFNGTLPQPPSNNGPFLDQGSGGRGPQQDPTYYSDSAVIAVRLPAAEQDMLALDPKVTSSSGQSDLGLLFDGKYNTAASIRPPADGGPAWLRIEFGQPFTARAITIGTTSGIPVGRVLAIGEDGIAQTLVTLPGAQHYRQGRVRTFAFGPVTAKTYPMEFTGGPIGPAQTISQEPTQPARQYVLTELRLHSGGRVHRWEEKASFCHLFEYQTVPTLDYPPYLVVRRSDVIDLTSKMRPDGSLSWDVPEGRWAILRMGYSLTGAKEPTGSTFWFRLRGR